MFTAFSPELFSVQIEQQINFLIMEHQSQVLKSGADHQTPHGFPPVNMNLLTHYRQGSSLPVNHTFSVWSATLSPFYAFSLITSCLPVSEFRRKADASRWMPCVNFL